jgi:hypothetical protein
MSIYSSLSFIIFLSSFFFSLCHGGGTAQQLSTATANQRKSMEGRRRHDHIFSFFMSKVSRSSLDFLVLTQNV